MILSSIDNKAMTKIGGKAAVEYVEANEWETEVLRWFLQICGTANAVQDSRLMYIWNSMSGYDLGEICRQWIAYGCGLRAKDVLDAITSMDENPAPSIAPGGEV